MKNIINSIILLCILMPSLAMAQEEKEVKIQTDVAEATVFIDGAQVLRKKSVSLLPGNSKLVFTNLSPYIDAKSVQVKLSGEAMVLSVNYQTNIVEAIKKISAEKNKEMDKEFEIVSKNLVTERVNKELIKDEMDFLNQNKQIGGSNTGVSLVTLRETANYYRDRMTSLRMKDIEVTKKISELEAELRFLKIEQAQEGTTEKAKPVGEVVVELESKKTTSVNVELTYYVKNAGWFPSYDIRAISIDKPIELLYKANIHQNTNEDWKNVKLSISSANPNTSTITPQLKTYFLDYYTAPPRYDAQVGANEAKGIVTDEQGEALPGVSVVVNGTTIGTATDMDGKFSLATPQGAREITFSYVGYNRKVVAVSNSFMNIRLDESVQMLEEVVVTGYGITPKTALTGAAAGVKIRGKASKATTVTRADIAMPTTQVENQTAVEFEIKVPYTILSNNKNTVIEVDRYSLFAEYEYYSIPKISKEAFLLANVSDWEKYNLLEGEANIFFENTYIGKTILDTRYVSDTLNISLGRDKNILVSREKLKDYSSKKFLGSKKEETRAWKINVRNNKNQAINFTILDQVPVSTNAQIEVETEKLSGASLDSETGEVKWNLKLKPAEKKELELRYKVKYPKDKNLPIE